MDGERSGAAGFLPAAVRGERWPAALGPCGSDRESGHRCQHFERGPVDSGGGVERMDQGRIGFPVELGGGRRCHRGVAIMNANFSVGQMGADGQEAGLCA